MNSSISTIRDTSSPRPKRIDAIKRLGMVRQLHKGGHLDMGGHLGVDELPGQIELREVIQNSLDHIDVRCHAAGVAAKTDNQSALDWCNELIAQYI